MNVLVRDFNVAVEHGSAAISVRKITKSYRPGVPVFSDISFEVAKGSIVALIGANGAGKSTLLRCLPGLIAPDSGEISVLGHKVERSARSLRSIRRKIGFVFQQHNLVGRASALTNVVHGAQARGYGPRAWSQAFAPSSLRDEAAEKLDRVGLGHLARQRADQLSGGQSQRVAIARALMQRPDIVLADEPAASLDPQAGRDVMELFSLLMRDEKKTVVFTSHNLAHALTYADRVIALGEGRVLADAPTQGVREEELHAIYH